MKVPDPFFFLMSWNLWQNEHCKFSENTSMKYFNKLPINLTLKVKIPIYIIILPSSFFLFCIHVEEFPLKWHSLPLLYHYLPLPKGWKHESIWFLSFRQRAELLYAFSPLLVVKNPYHCRVKLGVIQRLRKYIKNKSEVLSKSTSNSCIRSKADILTLI